MSRIDVCRVCLAIDVRMHHIRNTQMQEVFEKLTSKKLTLDGRPETICYLCHSQLLKCCRVLDLYQKTENVFTQLSCGGIEITKDTISFLKRSNIINLLMTAVRHVEVLPTENVSGLQQVTVKEEPIEVKLEPIESAMECNMESEESLYDDDSTNDSTWQMETTQEEQRAKYKKHKQKDIQKIDTQQKKLKPNTHMKTNTVVKPYTCELCNKAFERKYYLQQHMQRHSAEKLYTCNECNQTFTFYNNLLRHCKVIHKGNRNQCSCDKCGKTFSRCDHLKKHMRSHSGEKPYACKICEMSFSSASGVQQHINSIHSNVKPFTCDKCGKTFSRKGNLKEHYRVHTGEKPFICDKCDFKCSHLANLKAHISKIHIN